MNGRHTLVACYLGFLAFCYVTMGAGDTKYDISLLEGKESARNKRATDVSSAKYIYDRSKQSFKSKATYYGVYSGGGACSLDPLSPLTSQPGWIRVAAGRDDFKESLGCGMCVEIKGSGKGSGLNAVTGVTKAVVHDKCGDCGKGGYDLYIPGDGEWEIESRAIDCPTLPGQNGNMMLRFTGSNLWYVKLQARNTKVPTAGIEIMKNGKYSCMMRTGDNYFTGDDLGQVSFPMKVRVTAVTGEQKEATIPAIDIETMNDIDIPVNIQFGGFAVGPGPSSIKCAGQGSKPPYPVGGMTSGKGSAPSNAQPAPGLPPLHPTSPTVPPAPPVPPSPPSGGGVSAPGTASGGGAAGSDFCSNKDSGTYLDPTDCAGYIICNNGMTYRQKCAPGLYVRADTLSCDEAKHVDCGSRPVLSDSAAGHSGTNRGPNMTPVRPPAGLASQDTKSPYRNEHHWNNFPFQPIPPYEIDLRLEKAKGHSVLYKGNEQAYLQQKEPTRTTSAQVIGKEVDHAYFDQFQGGRGYLKHIGTNNEQLQNAQALETRL